MPTPTGSVDPPAVLVDRLRAAGCVFAEDEARLLRDAAATPVELEHLVERRVVGEPLEHLLGWTEFHGLRIVVGPGVFVPRQRTGFLVDQAATLAAELPNPVLVDLCCGSGAVGAALLAELPGAVVHAVDLDPVAVGYARRNLPGQVHQGDLYRPLPAGLRGQVHVLVANTPYVPTGELDTMPREARDHEPKLALDGGPDGLDIQRRVAAEAADWLAPGGHLLVETSERQVPSSSAAFRRGGLRTRAARSAGLDCTVVIGTRA